MVQGDEAAIGAPSAVKVIDGKVVEIEGITPNTRLRERVRAAKEMSSIIETKYTLTKRNLSGDDDKSQTETLDTVLAEVYGPMAKVLKPRGDQAKLVGSTGP